jgi:SAM-dependent methyltransferase
MPSWFAHVDAGALWERITERQARVAIDDLLPRLCTAPPEGACVPTADGVCVTPAAADGDASGWDVEEGKLHVSVTGARVTLPVDAMKWAGDAPPPWLPRGPFVRLEARRDSTGSRGGPLGSVFVAVGQLFTVAELQRALQRSFENGLARPGRHGLVVSSEIPPPRTRAPEARDWSFRGVFRCENPRCGGRNAEVILPFSSRMAWEAFEGRQASLPGPFPCPRCPGPAPARWALAWVRNLRPGDAVGSGPVLELAVWPPGTRSTNQSIAMAEDAFRSGLCGGWGAEWNAESLTQRLVATRPLLARGARGPAQFARAIGRMPPEGAPIAGSLLSAENLRALVDHCRTAPESGRAPGVPTALAYAYDPRRTSRWATEKDARQQRDEHRDYIALDPELFAQRLFACGADRAGAFLDVGCGTGEKPFLAYALGGFDQADGLEYDAKTVAVAEYLLHGAATRQPYPIRVFCQDALVFDRYGDYDVVYMWRPLRSAALMRRLIARIAAQMKVGAIVMDVRVHAALRRTATGYVTIANPGAPGPWQWTVEADLEALVEGW